MAVTDEQKRVLAQTLLGEAGGEGYEGMLAVAHVLNNRAHSSRFPNDPVSVAMQPQQFSTWNAGEGGNNPGRYGPGSPGYDDAIRAVEAVFEGNAPDPTGGATHYWAPNGMPNGADPYWASSEQSNYGRLPIGNHVFLPTRNPSSAAEAAQQMGGGSVSYGTELGQVNPNSIPLPRPRPDISREMPPLPRPDPRPPRQPFNTPSQQITPMQELTELVTFSGRPSEQNRYPLETMPVRNDPRVTYYPTTFDQRIAPPTIAQGPAQTRNERLADDVRVPSRLAPPDLISTSFQRVADARRPQNTPPEPRIQQASLPPPVPATRPQTTAMPSNLQSQINANPLGMGIATTAPFIPGETWTPRPVAAPAPQPPKMDGIGTGASLGDLSAFMGAPTPATMPSNLRGDPLAHIVPDPVPPRVMPPLPMPRPQTAPVVQNNGLAGLLGSLFEAAQNPTFTNQSLEPRGQPSGQQAQPQRLVRTSQGLKPVGSKVNGRTVSQNNWFNQMVGIS